MDMCYSVWVTLTVKIVQELKSEVSELIKRVTVITKKKIQVARWRIELFLSPSKVNIVPTQFLFDLIKFIQATSAKFSLMLNFTITNTVKWVSKISNVTQKLLNHTISSAHISLSLSLCPPIYIYIYIYIYIHTHTHKCVMYIFIHGCSRTVNRRPAINSTL